MFFGQRLPVQIKGTGLAGLARAFPTTMLMHHHTPQGFNVCGNPYGVLNREDQFARLGRGLIAHAVVGRFHRGWLIIGRFLGSEAKSEGEEAE
mgnify:CR=1 FL=1